jgi:hypothetical protein
MDKLTINLKIPILVDSLIGAPALTFTRWLPLDIENGIVINENDFVIILWFDIEATRWASVVKKEELHKNVNVLAHYIFATIELKTTDKELLNYIKNKDYAHLSNKENKGIQQKYELFGVEVLKSTLERVNRLIAYARDIKGQYWIRKYIINLDQLSKFFTKFEAKAKINNGKWFRFSPAATDKFVIEIETESKYISKDEWPNVIEFVRADKKVPAFGELLSSAEQLHGNGFFRSAITEACSALEVLINKFKESPSANDKLSMIYFNRLTDSNLKNQIDHLGITGTINYLLPLIIPESVLATDILKGCQLALQLRHNVLHNAQRNITKNETRMCINSIKKLNERLESYRVFRILCVNA